MFAIKVVQIYDEIFFKILTLSYVESCSDVKLSPIHYILHVYQPLNKLERLSLASFSD